MRRTTKSGFGISALIIFSANLDCARPGKRANTQVRPYAVAETMINVGFSILHALLFCLLVSFFFGDSPAVGTDAEPEPVVLQLKWFHQFQFAGYYAAQAKGYYRDAGLVVDIREGNPRTDGVKEVAEERAQYGISNSDVLLRRLRGDPVVVLAVIFQHSPLVMVATEKSGIRHPQHMKGRRVGISRSTRDAELLAMLRNEGVSLDDIEPPEGGSFSFSMYYDGSADAVSAYVTNEPFILEKKGIPFRLIRPLTYGIDFYGDCLFTSESEVDRHPGRVRRFREASLRGWEYAMAHPEEMADLIIDRYGSDKPRDHLLYEADKMQDLILPRLVEIGHMNPGRWRHIADTFVNLGMIDADYDLDGFLYDPDPRPNIAEIRRFLVILALAGSAVAFGVGCLLAFNRRLRKEVKERQEAEKTLRFQAELMDQIQDIILATDLRGRIQYINDAALRTLQKSREALIGQNVRVLGQDESMVSQREIIEKTLTRGRWRGRVANIRPDGSRRLFETRTWVVRDVEGEPTGMVGVSTDITERVRMEEDLVAARNEAVAANRAKSVFLANMSHELRTPMNAILGFSQLIDRDELLDPEHREYLSIIQRNGEHLLTLINDVLDMSKIEAGRMLLKEAVFDLPNLLSDLKTMFAFRAEKKGLYLRVESNPNVPRHVRTDETKLRQVLINLMGNAVKFTEQGGVTVRVDGEAVETEENGAAASSRDASHMLHFTVEDTGPGIAPEDRETLFDAFAQTGAGRREREGTGLGLAISRKFVRLMGGDITVRGEVGEGAAFDFDIRVVAVAPDDAERRAVGHRVTGTASGQPRHKLLIVDDDADNRRLLRRMLGPLNLPIREAENGREALEIWDSWRPALIWLDMRMPVMDGYEAVRKIRELETGRPRTIVIAQSASSFEEERHAILDAGCDDFLRKPFKTSEVFERIHRHLGVRFIRKSLQEAEQENDVGDPADQAAGLGDIPQALLRRLHEKVIEANAMEMEEIIEEIGNIHPRVGGMLAALADEFEYEKISEMIEGTGEIQ